MSRRLWRAEAERVLGELRADAGYPLEGGRAGLPQHPCCYIEFDPVRGSVRAGKAEKPYDRWRNPTSILSVARWHLELQSLRTMPLDEFRRRAPSPKSKWLSEARRVFYSPAAFDVHVRTARPRFFVVHGFESMSEYDARAGCCERTIVDVIREQDAWFDYNGESLGRKTCTERAHRHTAGAYCGCEAAGLGLTLDDYKARASRGTLGPTLQYVARAISRPRVWPQCAQPLI
jgi:hypothetical protein